MLLELCRAWFSCGKCEQQINLKKYPLGGYNSMRQVYEYFVVKPEAKLDLRKTYLRIEFLTHAEKAAKEDALKRIQQTYSKDTDCIIPFTEFFQVSFRCVLNAAVLDPTISNTIPLPTLQAHIEVAFSEDLASFMQANVKSISGMYFKDALQNGERAIPLYSQREVSKYTPAQIFEVVYEQTSLLERLKAGAKKLIRGIPNAILALSGRIIKLMLSFMGLGSFNSIAMKLLPGKVVMEWVFAVLTMFFPFLGPLLKIGQLFK